jgi:lysophospholipase L1-like esterase
MSTRNQPLAIKTTQKSGSWRSGWLSGFATLLLASSLAFAGSVAAQTGHWVGTWATSADIAGEPFDNQTLRQIVYVSVGGNRVRVRFSNLFGEGPLEIASASIAVPAAGPAIVPGTLEPLTFGGEPSVTIAAGAKALSDPMDFDLAATSTVAVTLYVASPTVAPTVHSRSHQTNYVSPPGDFTDSDVMPVAQEVLSWFWLSGIEVFAHPNTEAVVTTGDSITEGFNSTPDTNARYPDELARRLAARTPGQPKMAVLNAGISGNRILSDVFGPNGQSRLDRDVLTESGATRIILLEGINDLGLGGSFFPPPVSAEQIIAGYKQVITRAKAQDMKIYLGTITPCKGFEAFVPGYWSPEVEAERQAVNAWIRGTEMHDGYVDFDLALRNPEDPESLLPIYDSGDFLHPSDAGYARMAEEAEKVLFAPAKGKGPRK